MAEDVRAEMVSTVFQIVVAEGDSVAVGDTLVVLESMKMEIPLQAPCDGVVTHVLQQPGGRVQAGQPLVVLRDEALDTVA